MSRHKTTIQIAVVAAMLLLAGSAPASARGVDGRSKAQISKYERYETSPLPSLWRWFKGKLTRYAMAAN